MRRDQSAQTHPNDLAETKSWIRDMEKVASPISLLGDMVYILFAL